MENGNESQDLIISKIDVLDFGNMVRLGTEELKSKFGDEREGALSKNILMGVNPHQEAKPAHTNSNFLVSPMDDPDTET